MPVRADTSSESRFVKKNNGSSGVIIFVHGVFGGPETWCSETRRPCVPKQSTDWPKCDACWPYLIATDDDFLSDDVYEVIYRTPLIRHASNIEEIAQHVLQQLDDAGLLKYQHVYFITHSMGGLIVKRMLNLLDRPSRMADLQHVRAAILISVPSQGAPVAELGAWLSLNPQLRDMKPADLNTFLQSLENDWQFMLRERSIYPRVYCAYETLPTHGITVVNRVYASTYCDRTPYAMDCDHVEIVKPRDTTSDIYVWAKARMREADALTPKN